MDDDRQTQQGQQGKPCRPAYTIRPVTAADVAELQRISRETFKVTFDPFTKPADMARFLDEDYATGKLLREIADPDSRFFFLVVEGEVAGYLKVNVGQAQTERLKPNALEVERIYLRGKFQHRGWATSCSSSPRGSPARRSATGCGSASTSTTRTRRTSTSTTASRG